jgi:hypothetical protein
MGSYYFTPATKGNKEIGAKADFLVNKRLSIGRLCAKMGKRRGTSAGIRRATTHAKVKVTQKLAIFGTTIQIASHYP